MPAYYIGMGQGIIGQGPEVVPDEGEDEPWSQQGPNFYVRTTSLSSCTLICGYNSATRRGGAFHYPYGLKRTAESSTEQIVILDGMDNWIASLMPTQVTLVSSKAANSKETKWVLEWLQQPRGFPPPEVGKHVPSAFGGMKIIGNLAKGQVQYNAGVPDYDLHIPRAMKANDMRKFAAGHYARRTPAVDLFGKDDSGGALGGIDDVSDLKDYPADDSSGDSTDDDDDDS